MGFPRGMRRDRVALEQRRMKAAQLLDRGLTEAEVARQVGVSRQSVSRWARTLVRTGRQGLRRTARAGRPPKLSEAKLRSVEHCLKQGPEHFGYTTGLWTLGRVAKLIEQQCGVRYDRSQVWRILRKLNWSCQRPSGRAIERDEPRIAHWKKVEWPRIKKKPCGSAASSCSSTRAD
jgi:transposase